MPLFHSEPYLQLAGVSHKSALIAWGAFYFRLEEGNDSVRKLVDDSKLARQHPPRHGTVGLRAESYGPAVVRVYRESDPVLAETFDPRGDGPRPHAERPVVELFVNETAGNFCFVPGLEPDTAYWYEVNVANEPWAEGTRWDWDPRRQALVQSGGFYRNRFRTFPHPEDATPRMSFAVIGDFGVGVKKEDQGRNQRAVAAALRRTCAAEAARFLVTTGDNIYARGLFREKSSGDEDDDWFFTFYQPYRYLINQIPVYPCIGNHDAKETEGGQGEENADAMDDRRQLYDNTYLELRLAGEEAAGRASVGPGLFYRFRFGKDLELVCLDTSKEEGVLGGLIGGTAADGFKERLIKHPRHRSFIEQAFPPRTTNSPKWILPFFHHPVFCAGPLHPSTKEVTEPVFTNPTGGAPLSLLDLFKRSGVRLVLTGHEHNFQHCGKDGEHYLVTGGGAKSRPEEPKAEKRRDALLRSWSPDCHFLIVTVDGDKIQVRPLVPATDPSQAAVDLDRKQYDLDGAELVSVSGGIEVVAP
jgi:tartrate-resistant acid phosphatase type 5